MEFAFELGLGKEFGPVTGNVDAILSGFEQFHRFFLFAGAEDEADGRVLARLGFVFREPAEIQFHLAFVAGFELVKFQINRHQPPQAPVVEQQVDVEILAPDFPGQHVGQDAAEDAGLTKQSVLQIAAERQAFDHLRKRSL